MKDRAHIIQLPKIQDPRGNLTFLQFPDQIPFEIKRVFWTYDVPGGEVRGGHAYKEQKELVVALSGSFDVVISHPNGKEERFYMNRSYFGLYLPPLTWRRIENFSTNSVSLHFSSSLFKQSDYIRDFGTFKTLSK